MKVRVFLVWRKSVQNEIREDEGRLGSYLGGQIRAEIILTRRLLFLFFDRTIARIPTMTP